MEELTEASRAALDAIRGGREAWSDLATLAAAGVARETLEALEAAGLAERWPLPEPVGEHWTLTALAAQRLGLRLDERLERLGDAIIEVPYWAPPAPRRGPSGFRGAGSRVYPSPTWSSTRGRTRRSCSSWTRPAASRSSSSARPSPATTGSPARPPAADGRRAS